MSLKVEDYLQTGKRSIDRFSEKGGKETEIPFHHKLEELLDQYLETSGVGNRPNAPLPSSFLLGDERSAFGFLLS